MDNNTDLLHSLDIQKRKSRLFPKILLFITVFLAVGGAFGYFSLYRPLIKLSHSIAQLESSGQQIGSYLKNQDLPGAQNQLLQTQTDLQTVRSDFSRLKWLNALPIVKNYYQDGQHLLAAGGESLSAGMVAIESIAPYADIVGLKSLSSTGDGAKTAQDRINFIVNSIDKMKPQFSQIGTHLEAARKEIDQINPSRYPETVKNFPVRSRLTSIIALLDQASILVNDAEPLLDAAPYILGVSSPRTYLVIFQNDAELRPTGGFMTAYAILEVNKGKINTVLSDDIYALDAKFTKRIPAPEPIKKYLPKVAYWNLRDQNLSPDFKASMDTFFPNYRLTGSPKVDGIVALDTQVLVDLLKVTGPIGVPGFGNFSANVDPRCNCPQVFYELELYADVEGPVVWDSVSGQIVVKPKNYGERKNFIGPMMYSVLANVMAQPKHKMGELFTSVFSLIQAKHIQFYYPDAEIQSAIEAFNLGGRVREFPGDYLLVVDTNFAGAKTNAWITYNADLKTEISGDGSVTNLLTLTYKNPQPNFQDEKTKLRLNGVFRDWLRVYVPKGSTLLESKGFETGQTTGTDLDKTIFEGFFTLTPLNVKTITFKYQLPFKVKTPYRLLIQKQAGTKNFPYQITLNRSKQPELLLSSDQELTLPF